MSMTFNPMAVMMKQPGKPGVPYIGGGQPPMAGQFSEGPPKPSWSGNPVGMKQYSSSGGGGTAPQQQAQQPQNVLGAESVRAIGTGPFDQAYRQDLATYAGGLFSRPGGNLSFNPTSNQPFGGAAVGGGNAPIFGIPNTLLGNALGGNPFSFTPPQPAQGAQNNQPDLNQLQQWLNQFMNQGKGQRLANSQ